MRKTVILLLAVVLILTVSVSCAYSVSDGECLGYQTRHFELNGRITLDGKTLRCEITSVPNEKITLTVTEPGRLSGLCYEMKDGPKDEFTLTFDGVSFDSKGEYALNNGIPAVKSLFRIDKDSFIVAEVVDASGIRMSAVDFRLDGGRARVFLDRDSTPRRIEGVINGHEITVIIENFKVIREE